VGHCTTLTYLVVDGLSELVVLNRHGFLAFDNTLCLIRKRELILRIHITDNSGYKVSGSFHEQGEAQADRGFLARSPRTPSAFGLFKGRRSRATKTPQGVARRVRGVLSGIMTLEQTRRCV